MTVHQKINFRALNEWYNTPDRTTCRLYGLKYYKHGLKPKNEIPLIYYTLWQMAKIAQSRTNFGGKHYCGDCKGYHFTDRSYFEFKEKFGKYFDYIYKIDRNIL